MFEVVIFLITYFICSLSPAIIICRLKNGDDIRELGSGNAGTTNAVRVLGKPLGVLVFILDILKAILAFGVVNLFAKMFGYTNISLLNSIFIVAAVIGHCYPIYYNFKGGKGVAVSLICVFLLDFKIALICLIVGIIIIGITRFVSLASVSGVILLDIMVLVMMPQYIIACLIISAIVIFKHRTNIQRILNNEENKLF